MLTHLGTGWSEPDLTAQSFKLSLEMEPTSAILKKVISDQGTHICILLNYFQKIGKFLLILSLSLPLFGLGL